MTAVVGRIVNRSRGAARGAFVFGALLMFVSRCEPRNEPDLLAIRPLVAKGRAQDTLDIMPNPVVEDLLARGTEAIPYLIGRLESERRYPGPVLPYWPEVREGDVALVLLSDFFLDPSFTKSTLPELCWDSVIPPDRTGDAPASQRLHALVAQHGRGGLRSKWEAAWREHREDIYWDERGRFFRVRSRPLKECETAEPLDDRLP